MSSLDPGAAGRSARLRLRHEMERDLAAASGFLVDLAPHLEAIRSGDDPILLGYAAVTLHRVYTALESIFERIARVCDGSVPTGPRHHRDLLEAMTFEMEGLRPAVLRALTASRLAALLGFRHFVRHAYAVDWDGARIAGILDSAVAVWSDVEADLAEFHAFLRASIQ